jgi:hypothetical protein
VSSRVHCAVRATREPNTLSREERRTRRRKALRKILEQTSNVDEQVKLHEEETGGSRADFYRRKHDIESGEFDGEEAA